MQRIAITGEKQWLALRQKFIGSTGTPALFGVSPYYSPFALWHMMKGKVEWPDLSDSDRVRWGKRLEGPIARGWAEDAGIPVTKVKYYAIASDAAKTRLGCSLDFETSGKKKKGVVEVKNIDQLIYRANWLDGEGDFDPPVHIHVQGQSQLAVTDWDHGYYIGLVGGNMLVQYHFERSDKIVGEIRRLATEFTKLLAADTPPPVDGHKATTEAIAHLLIRERLTKTVEDLNDGDLESKIDQRQLLVGQAASINEKIQEIENEVRLRMAEFERGVCGYWNVSYTQVPETIVPNYVRRPYRRLLITERKAAIPGMSQELRSAADLLNRPLGL